MRITEGTLRRIVREEIVSENIRSGRMGLREARRILREDKQADINVLQFGRGLGAEGMSDIYSDAPTLKKEMERLKSDFDEGMAVIKQSKSGDGFDMFLSHTSTDPVNKSPIPGKAFGKAGIQLDLQEPEQMSSAAKARRNMK